MSYPQIALGAGILLGAFLLIIVGVNYLRHDTTGAGGVAMLAFGTILLGLSIFKNVEFSGFSASLRDSFTDLSRTYYANVDSLTRLGEALKQTQSDLAKLATDVAALPPSGPGGTTTTRLIADIASTSSRTQSMTKSIEKVSADTTTFKKHYEVSSKLLKLPPLRPRPR
jgi:methyl-accepting chemotaxis protein